MRGWQDILEEGINQAWGGTFPTGYSATRNLVALVASCLDQAGYVVVRADEVVGRRSAEMAVRIMAEGAHIDGTLHPAACGPRCRSRHTDDHSECEHNDGPDFITGFHNKERADG